MRLPPTLAPIAGLICVGAGSISCTTSTSAAPPLKICGVTVWRGAAGAATTKAYQHKTTAATDTAGPHGANYYILTSPSCRTGSHVDLHELKSSVVRIIHASDGATAAVVLDQVRPGRRLRFVTADHKTHEVTFG